MHCVVRTGMLPFVCMRAPVANTGVAYNTTYILQEVDAHSLISMQCVPCGVISGQCREHAVMKAARPASRAGRHGIGIHTFQADVIRTFH